MIVLITAITAGICVLCLYSVYGNVIRHETTLHDLRCRVELLQNNQIIHLAEIKGEIAPEDIQSENDEGIELGVAEDPDADINQSADQSVEQLASSSTIAA